MAVRFPPPDVRLKIATELGRVWPPENWIVIPRNEREDNVKGETPFVKGKLGDPDKTNALLAKEMTEALGAKVSSRSVSKWRNRKISEVKTDTKMPTAGYRSNRG